MIIKDYSDADSARTLTTDAIYNNNTDWIVEATIQSDYYEWINDFVAYNKKTGAIVAGNFESTVIATSEYDLDDFLRLFPYEEWDYDDI
jgi:hypothetical protein